MEFNTILYGEIKFVPHNIDKNVTSNDDSETAPIKAPKRPFNGPNLVNDNNNSKDDPELATFKAPKRLLSDPSLIKLDWQQSDKIGGGLVNVGNTCFLNSVLQCLTYCPPLHNYLIKYNGGHSSTCKLNGFCMLCEMEKHIRRIRNSNGIPIKPNSIVQRLKFINKSFQFGRQEDAHEFLRYLIDHMWKACLMNLDINVKSNNCGDKIDQKIKETTVINHIFGGYHRSQVLCLTCNSRSNTFDFFMDFILDIRNAKSLEDSLRKFTQPETLDHDNAYKCGRCKKKVTARKRFSVFKAPNVATFQLKRFDSDRIFGGKITKYVSYPEELDLRPYMSDCSKGPIRYQLSAVLVHVGHSSNSGHYFCFIRNSNGFWYRMDDSNVTVVNKNVALQQQAYILFYIRKSSEIKQHPSHNGVDKITSCSISSDDSHKNLKTVSINGSSFENNHKDIHSRMKSEVPSTAKSNVDPVTPNHKSNGFSQPLSATASTSPSKRKEGTDENSPDDNLNKIKPPLTSLTTWLGVKSKLDDDDSSKRKLNEITDRDKFNEELDQGKVKKIKSHNRDEKFTNLSKSNLFQRYCGTNGYQQLVDTNAKQDGTKNGFHHKDNDRHHGYDNNNRNFQRHNHHLKSNSFRRHNGSHKHNFSNHRGKHKNRHFNHRK